MAKNPKTPKADNLEKSDKVEDAVVMAESGGADEPEFDSILPGKPSTEPESEQAPVLADRPNRPIGSFAALVLGGVLAAAVGFAMARYVVPEGWPFPGVTPDPDPLALAQKAQDVRLKALEGASLAQDNALAALRSDTGLEQLRGEIRGEFGALQAQLQALGARLDGAEARLGAVEKLPQGSGTEAAEAAAAAYERELMEMRAMLERELARIADVQADAEELEANAAKAALAATGRAAMARVLTALDTGRPFDDALFDLGEATGIEAPAALANLAETGVPTLAALQAGFPDAARAALSASIQAGVEDGSVDRFTAFMRTQLGTRSLEPREGDDPDAILSRAEAALRQGQIALALDEIAALPDAAHPALAEWIATATARLNALAASEELARQLNTN